MIDQAEASPGIVGDLLRAEVLERVGDTAAARQIYEAQAQDWNREATLARLFQLDLASGNLEQAASSYAVLRDLGWSADPLGYHRLSLTFRYPTAPWAVRDILGILGLVMVLVLFAGVAPAFVMLPVHYVGLLRRSRGASVVETRWTLRDAWRASAILLAGSLLSLYAFSYSELASWFDAISVEPTRVELARSTLWSLLATSAAALAVMKKTDWKAISSGLWPGTGSTMRAAFRGLLLVFVTGWVSHGVFKALGLLPGHSAGVASATHDALKAVGDAYGSLTLFVMVAIVTPIAEEVFFRGVTFDAFRGHLPNRWANVAQAALFTLIHQEWTSFPLLFVMGVVTGSLRLRTGSLAAGILLHAANNALVYALRL